MLTEAAEYREGTSGTNNEPDEGSYDAGPDRWSLHRSRSAGARNGHATTLPREDAPQSVLYLSMSSPGSLLPEFLGKPDENSFGAPDVAEPIRFFVLNHLADELRSAFAEPGERIVDVVHGEHDA